MATNNIFKSDAEDTVDVDYLPNYNAMVTDTYLSGTYTNQTHAMKI